jgi:hypothetical protein
MAEVNSNPGLDALWAYARSQPQKEIYMDRKQRDIELAREVGFNTEHPATNEWLHQYAQRVRAEAALDRMADNAKELGLDYEPKEKNHG